MRTLFLAVANLVFAVGLPAASLRYTTFTVPNSLDLTTLPTGINDDGQVVGSFQDLDGVFHGFIRSADGKTYSLVDFPGSVYTTALGINNKGEIIGLFSEPLARPAAYVRSADGSSFRTLPLLGRPLSIYGLGMNNEGKVVGYYQENGQFHSFLCDTSTSSCADLAVPGATVTVAKAINDQGQVAGYVVADGQTRAFLFNPDGTTAIFDAPDATASTVATAISDNGQIAGYFHSSTGLHNFLRSGDGSTFASFDDPSVSSGSSYATGINSSSEVVGYSLPAFDHFQGFVGASTVGPYPVSDDFTGSSLNPSLWTFVNPKNDSSYAVNGSELLLNVPAGSNHETETVGTDNSVHVMQAVRNSDFTVELKFDTIPELRYQSEGLLVEQDGSNFLKFQLRSTGDSLTAGARWISSNTETNLADSTISIPPGAASIWLRVQRTGDTWIATWSADGLTYNPAASFTQPLTVASLGPFAGNYNEADGVQPAFVASVDYFLGQILP